MFKYLVLSTLFFSLNLLAAEVDQITNRAEDVKDSIHIVNTQSDNYLQTALSQLITDKVGCDESLLYKEMQKYFENHIKGEISNWMIASDKISKSNILIKDSIYRDWSIWDGIILGRPGADTSPLAMTPLVRFNDVRFGVDKMEHLFDRGFAYFKRHYQKQLSIEETIMRGHYWEKNFYGGKKWGTGVFSFSDLVANFNGMRFWNDVLRKNRDILGREVAPLVRCENNQWVQNRKVDLSLYVDQGYDEGINCSQYPTEKTTSKVITAVTRVMQTESYGVCPYAEDHLEKLTRKYGYFAKFLINNEGVKKAKSLLELEESFNNSKGWEPVPSKYKKLLKSARHRNARLEYLKQSKYIRMFRIEESSRKYRRVSYSALKLKDNIPAKAKKCWNIFISGGDCFKEIEKPLPAAYTSTGELDALTYVRDTSRLHGLVVARDEFVKVAKEKDVSKGSLLNRVLQTTKDKYAVYGDSLSKINKEDRERIGVYFCLGIGGDESDNAKLIRLASEKVSELGFKSEMLEVDPNLGSAHNAKLLRKIIKERITKLDKIVFVAASKGAADFITYFLNYADDLSPEERNKVKLMVTLSGVIRGSFIADYMSHAKDALGIIMRAGLKLTGSGDMLLGVESLSKDPWQGHDPAQMKKDFPSLKWINFPAVPEGDMALTNLSLWSGFMKKPAHEWVKKASPGDGLVESAASILPPGTGMSEMIIPVFGPHAMALGRYEDGTRVAPIAMKGLTDRVNPEAGPEILDAYFRALPATLLE
jgi:hypothetical protein